MSGRIFQRVKHIVALFGHSLTSATTICSPFCDPGGMSVSPALASGICDLNSLEAARQSQPALYWDGG